MIRGAHKQWRDPYWADSPSQGVWAKTSKGIMEAEIRPQMEVPAFEVVNKFSRGQKAQQSTPSVLGNLNKCQMQ